MGTTDRLLSTLRTSNKLPRKVLLSDLCTHSYLYHIDGITSGKRRYNIKLWKTFTDCFNCLPIAAIVDEKIFCCHGGLSPDLQSMEQIRRIMRPTDVPDTGNSNLLFDCVNELSVRVIVRLIVV